MAAAELMTQAGAELSHWLAAAVSTPQQVVAHVAAALGLVLAVGGALMRTMLPLRWLAVGSNTGLLAYGVLHPSPTTLWLAAALLPVNLYRAIEVTRLTRRVSLAGVAAEMAALWLRPHMKTRKFKAGQLLFAKGDPADRLYLLVQGHMKLVGLGKPLEVGKIFGEIALFSPERVRTQAVQCISDCTVLEIHESTVRQLYFQSPAFGFHLIELLAARLGEDVQRVGRAAAAEGDSP